MDGYTLSVIIPNYNKEKYLAQCLDSILTQTRMPDEIIIVDDCSRDQSREIIRKYQERCDKILPMMLDENVGVSQARNLGIDKASSIYITCLDSDDFYYSNHKLENEMNLIYQYGKRQQEILAYSSLVNVNEQGEVIYYTSRFAPLLALGNARWYFNGIVQVGYCPRDYCMKKSIVQSVGGYEVGQSFYEDFDLLVRLSDKVLFYQTKHHGTAYRNGNGGLSQQSKEMHKSTVKQIQRKYYGRLTTSEKIKANLYKLLSSTKILNVISKPYNVIDALRNGNKG
ncbi:MAG: glycosyltransferase family 2 protein [Eubacteriales bacterium]